MGSSGRKRRETGVAERRQISARGELRRHAAGEPPGMFRFRQPILKGWPDDVSVAGFDDVPEASRIEPPLTTVRQDSEEKGRRAAKFLLEMLDGQAEEDRHSVLPAELIVRKSTGKAR
jgi:DNA-binding LacI/PurR family transcriptional regulator